MGPSQRLPAVAAESCELLEYPESPDAIFTPSWTSWEEAPDAAPPEGRQRKKIEGEGAASTDTAAGAQKPDEECAFAAGYARGIEEGRLQERELHAAAHTDEESNRVCRAASLVEEFARERERYLRALEPEVVKLALAIAARVLRREAQADPLLLTGAVRVALGQVSGAAEVRLLVPAAELDLWTEAIAVLPKLAVKPLIMAGDGMRAGECRMETTSGSADLGVPAQLAEIERMFFGRLAETEAAQQPVEASR